MFIRELLALHVYNYFEMINPTCSFSLPLSFGRLKYLFRKFRITTKCYIIIYVVFKIMPIEIGHS